MCVYTYIYIYIYTILYYVYTYTYIHIYRYAYIYIYTHTCYVEMTERPGCVVAGIDQVPWKSLRHNNNYSNNSNNTYSYHNSYKVIVS